MAGHINEPGPRLQHTIRHQTTPLKTQPSTLMHFVLNIQESGIFRNPTAFHLGLITFGLPRQDITVKFWGFNPQVPQVADSPNKHSTGPQEKVVAPRGMQLGDATDFQSPCAYQVAIRFPVFLPSLRALRSQRLSYPASTRSCILSLYQVQVKGPHVLSSKAEGTGTAEWFNIKEAGQQERTRSPPKELSSAGIYTSETI